LSGQKTTTSPYGRDASHCGYPIRVAEMLSTMEGAAYIERVSLHDVPNINRPRKRSKRRFENQIAARASRL
jgi:2-oxoglutarate ferredoxin oxidoreductase subunit beta